MRIHPASNASGVEGEQERLDFRWGKVLKDAQRRQSTKGTHPTLQQNATVLIRTVRYAAYTQETIERKQSLAEASARWHKNSSEG